MRRLAKTCADPVFGQQLDRFVLAVDQELDAESSFKLTGERIKAIEHGAHANPTLAVDLVAAVDAVEHVMHRQWT